MSDCRVVRAGGKPHLTPSSSAALHVASKTALLDRVAVIGAKTDGLMATDGVKVTARGCSFNDSVQCGIGIFQASVHLEDCEIKGNMIGVTVVVPGNKTPREKPVVLRRCTLEGNLSDLVGGDEFLDCDSSSKIGKRMPLDPMRSMASLGLGGGGGGGGPSMDDLAKMLQQAGVGVGQDPSTLLQSLSELKGRFEGGLLKETAKATRKEQRAKGLVTCAHCGVNEPLEGKRFPSCSGCRTVVYCGEQCQKLHWRTHKPVCDSSKSMASSSIVQET